MTPSSSSRKKQKTSKDGEAYSFEPLGSRSRRGPANLEPSEEELRLTESLFGSKPGSSSRSSNAPPNKYVNGTGATDTDEEDGRNALEEIEDDQLFTIDAGSGAEDEDSEDEDSQSSGATSASSEADSELEEEDKAISRAILQDDRDRASPSPVDDAAPRRRRAVWTDPSTASMLIPLVGPNARAPDGSFAGTKRLRKLRASKDERELSGKEYEKRLREMYEKMHPRPAWASRTSFNSAQTTAKDSKKPSITTSAAASSSLADLLARDAGLVARSTGHSSQSRLPAGQIEVERLRDANAGLDSDLASAIESMEFHPSARAKLLMTASRDRRVRLYQIDGSGNPLLQTLHVPSLPITTATFHPLGSSILLSGPRPYLYSYDLQAGRVLRSSPWRSIASGSGQLNEEDFKEKDLSKAKFQPLDSTGQSRLLAIGGRRGVVHLLDWSVSGGAGGSLISSLRQNSPVVGLDWDQSPGANGRRLMTLGQEGTMSLWDVRNTKCEVIKRDVGLFGANGIAISPDGQFTSVGSESGIVNLYDAARLAPSTSASSSMMLEENVEANKALGNLTTTTTTMQFNHDGQILALASRNKKDALRLVHLPSLTVFSNWPTSGTPLGHVSDVAFASRGSQYMAIGNTRGRVLLYGMKHFTS